MANTDEESAKVFRDIVAAARLSPEHSNFLLHTLNAMLADRAKRRDAEAKYKIANAHVTEAIEEKEAAITERDNALLAREAARVEFSWMLDRMRRDSDKDLIAKLRANRDKFVDEVKDLKSAFKSQEAKVDDTIKEVKGAQAHLAARVKSVVALVCPDLEYTGSPIHDPLEDDPAVNLTPSRPNRVNSNPVSPSTMMINAWFSPPDTQHSSIHARQSSHQTTGADRDIPPGEDPLPPTAPLADDPDVLVNKLTPPTAVHAPLGLHSTAQRVIGVARGKGAHYGQSGSMTTGSGNVSTARPGKPLIRVDPARLTAGLKRKPSFINENLTSSKKLKQNDGTKVKKINQL